MKAGQREGSPEGTGIRRAGAGYKETIFGYYVQGPYACGTEEGTTRVIRRAWELIN